MCFFLKIVFLIIVEHLQMFLGPSHMEANHLILVYLRSIKQKVSKFTQACPTITPYIIYTGVLLLP